MSYAHVSVPKSGANPGRPRAKKPNVLFFRMKDVQTFPARDDKGIAIAGDLVLNPLANAIRVYFIPTTIKCYNTSTGDPDKKGYTQHFEGEHSGDDLAFEEWAENNINEDLGVIIEDLESGEKRLMGTLGCPLQFNVEGKNDNEAVSNTVTCESLLPGPRIAIYNGVLPAVDSEASGSGA